MRRNLLLILAVCLGLGAMLVAKPIAAQNDRPDCKPEAIIAQAQQLKQSGDKQKDMAALKALATQIEAQNVACNGFNFTGQGGKLIGPFTLPKGNYRMTVTTKNYFIADMQVSEGSCTNTDGDTFLYDLDEGEAVNGADTDLKSDGCQVTLEADTGDDPWTIIIKPVQ